MRALVGAPAYSVMTGISTRAAADSKRGRPLIEEWDQLDNLAVVFIIVPCPSAITHSIANCNHNAKAAGLNADNSWAGHSLPSPCF